ncbi:hypothetical protein [Streptomyces avermitilis]|uniref:hypothetical protein n=1 Tax=Streptomyces avermitilis TaxID=33903 RepID=UPI0037F5C22F
MSQPPSRSIYGQPDVLDLSRRLWPVKVEEPLAAALHAYSTDVSSGAAPSSPLLPLSSPPRTAGTSRMTPEKKTTWTVWRRG